MEIFITMVSGTQALMVQPSDTVGSLKLSIQAQLGVTVERQRLVYDNCQRVHLNDNTRTLSSYGLQSGSRVSLLVTEPVRPATIQVFLKNEKGKTQTYDIKPDETVNNFKVKVEQREGVPVSQQRLIHEGKEMMSGKLEDFGVREHSTIYLTFRLRGG